MYLPTYTGSFRHLVDIGFICSMGPPGGGRNPITPRLSRHFNYLSFTEMEDSSKFKIFSTILKSWMSTFPDCEELVPKIVNSTISVYQTITTEVNIHVHVLYVHVIIMYMYMYCIFCFLFNLFNSCCQPQPSHIIRSIFEISPKCFKGY